MPKKKTRKSPTILAHEVKCKAAWEYHKAKRGKDGKQRIAKKYNVSGSALAHYVQQGLHLEHERNRNAGKKTTPTSNGVKKESRALELVLNQVQEQTLPVEAAAEIIRNLNI